MSDPALSFSEMTPPDAGGLSRRTGAASAELEYLLQLRSHLSAAFELFDERCIPILPPGTGTLAKRLRRVALQPDGSPMRAALEQVLATGEPQMDVIDGLRIALARISGSNPLRASIIALAEPADDARRDASSRGLELMVGWLADMVGKPVGAIDSGRDAEWRQISSFCRVVSEQAVLGSETSVVRVFIEALAIWDDLDVRAYAATANGAFASAVALGGADPAIAPARLDADAVREDSTLTRLTPSELERLGFARENVAVARVADGAGIAWLLAFVGDIPPEAEARLSALVGVLTEVLSAARAVETSRLTWALLQSLVGGLDAADETIATAVQQLSQSLGRPAGLLVTRLDGAVLLSAGNAERLAGSPSAINVTHELPESCELLLTLGPDEDGQLLARDRRLLEAAASVFASWTAALLKRPDTFRGRRGSERAFDDILQQQIRFARDTGAELAVIVVKPSGAPAITVQRWVREVRGRLRAGDIAAALPTGEIGIVLPGTSLQEAAHVAERLRQTCLADPALASMASMAAGVVSLGGRDNESASSLLGAARTRAGDRGDAPPA